MTSPRPHGLACWWLAIRPRTLTIALAPVLVGSALAWTRQGALHWPSAILSLLAAVLIQIGTNLHNDVGDFERGSDPPDRLGPPRATAMGWLPARVVRRAAWFAFALALLCGSYLVWRGGWPILCIGIASLLAGWAYTGGPWPIAYRPLGELFVLVFFGLAGVSGTYYLQILSLSSSVLVSGLMVGLFAAAVLTVNNYRDLDTDARAGKRTLPVVMGRPAARWLYGAEMLGPFFLLPGLAGQFEWRAWFLLPMLLLPHVLGEMGRFRHLPASAQFNDILMRTAKLQWAFSLLVSMAIVASRQSP